MPLSGLKSELVALRVLAGNIALHPIGINSQETVLLLQNDPFWRSIHTVGMEWSPRSRTPTGGSCPGRLGAVSTPHSGLDVLSEGSGQKDPRGSSGWTLSLPGTVCPLSLWPKTVAPG